MLASAPSSQAAGVAARRTRPLARGASWVRVEDMGARKGWRLAPACLLARRTGRPPAGVPCKRRQRPWSCVTWEAATPPMDTLDAGALNFRWLLRLRWGAALGQLVLVLGAEAWLGIRLPVGALLLLILVELLSNAALSRWARGAPGLLA